MDVDMEGKPNHYDGSVQAEAKSNDLNGNEPFQLTDEMRANISGNPFVIDNNK